ncbi:MAG: hypothetical protein IKS51_00910 [Erysipelotrichaceae bacterium]|nr:hypothetical protein [Erysipelotrichaceae bacterium]
MQMTFNDRNTGQALLKAEVPEGFTSEACMNLEQYPNNRILRVYGRACKDGCAMYYQTGNVYILNKGNQNGFFQRFRPQDGQQNESGQYYAQLYDIKTDLDRTAASILQKEVQGTQYYNLSDRLTEKARKAFDTDIQKTVQEIQIAATVSSFPVSGIIRNYLFDGGMGVYEDEGKILAVCFCRFGMEFNLLKGPPVVQENLSNEAFGYAQNVFGTIASHASWTVPFITYMISDKKEDLATFMNFVDTVDLTPEVLSYAEQIRQQVSQQQAQMARMKTAETQAIIDSTWAQHNQRWAAAERMRDSLSQDLDRFHANLNQQMAQNDMRFNLGSSQQESLDDRIQRMRHESMMGVETYMRSDGSEVEYSNRADRVFENNLDNTVHFGTEHYYDDYVPDGWHELKKK